MFLHAGVERMLRILQIKKIVANPNSKKEGACIIADQHSLVFFPSPRGPKVFERFKKRLTV